jgi:rare lipoprotein A
MRPVLTHALVIAFVITGLGTARPSDSNSKPATSAVRSHPKVNSRKPYQVGRASWYGKNFHGKKTASGEPYNMFRFTAAHPTLPLGSMLKVTNLRNGRWVIVRVNDRGPVPPSRIIDLSYGAAQILGLSRQGVQRVRLDLVEPTQLAMAQVGLVGMD